LHHTGDLGAAETLYRQLLQAEPAHAEACHALGLVGLQRGGFDEAAPLLARARAADPTHPPFLLHDGVALQASGKLAQAAGAVADAVRFLPSLAEAHERVAQVRD